MLTGITLENFKAFKDPQFIPIKPITLVFGPNSAGKSSLLQALAILRHSFLNDGHAEADQIDVGWSKLRLGGWQNLVHGHDSTANFKIGLHFDAEYTPWDTEGEKTERWTVNWGFGRTPGNPEAGVISITAFRNGSLEFTGRWDQERKGWNLQFEAASLCGTKPAEFANCLVQHAPVSLSPSTTKLFSQWIESAVANSVFSHGLFPDAKPHEIRHRDYVEELSWASPPPHQEIFLKEVFSFNSSCDHSPIFNSSCDHKTKNPSSWPDQGKEILMAAEYLGEGKEPTDGAKIAARSVWESWMAWQAVSSPIYWNAAMEFEKIIQDYRHLDSVRERPSCNLNLRDLLDTPQNRPWRELIINASLRESVSNELATLTNDPNRNLPEGILDGYQLRIRNRVTITRQRCEDGPSENEISSTTSELAIRNPQGLLMTVHDVGYGISTVLPIVTAINYSQNALISIEQPELHIHPRLQTEMADLLLKSALREDGNTLIVETHSEHLILRILRRIRETTASECGEWPDSLKKACPNGIWPENVTVLYVNPPPEGSNEGSTVIVLPLTSDGDFSKPWPGGFFEERANEIF